MIPMKKRAMISPGRIPARKSWPIDCSVRMPYMMRTTEGGMMTPRVPTVATMPVDSLLS